MRSKQTERMILSFKNRKNFYSILSIFVIGIFLLIIVTNKNNYGADETTLLDYSNFKNIESSIITVNPTKMNGNYLDIDSAFEIITKDEMTIQELKEQIALKPAIDYTVLQIDSKNFIINPKEKIPYNTLLNVISVKEGNPLYKWAFETEKILSVKSTYPADTKTIYPNSVIEVTLTYSDVKNFEECFSISDNVKGRFEKNGYTYRFIPETKLKKGETYTITIKKGLTNGNHTMNSDYTFSFTVEETNILSTDEFYFTSMNIDDSLVFTPDEIPKVDIKFYNKDENTLLKNTTVDIEIYKINDIDTYISLLEMEKINFDNLELFDKFKTDIIKFGDSSYSQLAYIKFHKNMPIGNYIVKYSIGDVSKYHSIQISNIVAYVGNTEADIFAWVNDYETENAATNATISFKNKSSLTDENGVAIIKDFSKEKLGNYAKICYGNENLVLKLQSFNETYYNGYLYTDRPLYKTTDTINIWGIIPDKNLSKSKDVYIMFLDKKYPLSINSDGVFTTKIDIKDLKEGYNYLRLYIDDYVIASRSFQIEQYETPNYIYSIETDKEAYFENETIKITVTASHISGLKAVDKKLNIIYEDQNISCYTDNNGKCTVSMTATKEDRYYYITESQFIRVFPADSVDSEDLCHASITLINEKEEIITKSSNIDGKYLIDVTGNSLNVQSGSIKRKNDINSKVIVDIYEVSYDIKEVTKVDEYTKKTYTYNEYNNYQKKIIETKKYNLKNGKLTIDDLNYPDIKTNRNYKYYYFEIKLENSILYETEYYSSTTTTSYYTSNPYSTIWYKDNLYYSYTFPKTNPNYSISSKIDLTVNDYYKNQVNDKKMILFYNDSVVDYYIDENEVSYKDEYFPGVNIAGAIFDGKKIHKIDSKYLDYNDSDREVSITLNTDKEIYEPQDIVTVDVKVNDKDGKPIKTNLLISVVNEGIFELNDDYISLQQNLYVNKYFNFYHFTTYQAPIYNSSVLGGRGAAVGGGRSDFGDTIYFKNIQTDENGYAKISFKLNDSITTFRITAISANKDLYVGNTHTTIKSQLDYFIENSSLDGFKSSDDFVVALNTISDVNNNINYTFELNDKISSASGLTNNYLYQNFGKLNKGNYNLKISSTFGNKSDRIIDNFTIKDYYQNVRIVNVNDLKNGKQNIKSNDAITIELYDKSLEFYLKLINNLTYSGNDRLDQYVARKRGLDFYSKYNNITINNNVSIPNKLIENDKLLLLESAQFSPLLNALAVNYAENMLTTSIIERLKYETEKYLDENVTDDIYYFEYILLAASLEIISLEDLKELVPKDISDSINLALAYAFVGDYNSAIKIYDEKIVTDENYQNNKELISILLSFIKPNECKELLIKLDNSKNEYYVFAVISYLENSSPYISNNKITVNGEEYKLNYLSVLSFDFDSNDIKDLNISSENDNIKIRKVYYGNSTMIEDDSKIYDLELNLPDELILNQIYQIKVKLKNIPNNKCGDLYVVLPRGIKYYSINENFEKGVSILSNSGNKINLSVCTYNGKNDISFEIPVVAALEGNYVIESSIYNHNIYYGVSDEKIINIHK